MKRCIVCVGFALAACGLWAADRVWQADGDGDWSDSANWVGGEIPGAGDAAVFANALSADAAIRVGGVSQPVGVLRLQNATAPWRRIFTGSLVADLFEQDAGDVALAGEWRSPVQAISKLGNTAGALARLEVVSGGRLILTNTASVYIGNANNARGQLYIREGADVRFSSPTATASGLYIGRESGSVGAVVQTGGRMEKNTAFIPGYSGYGVYELLGGEFYHPYGNSQTRYRIGMNGPGLFYQRGGVYTASSNGSYALELAKNTAAVDAFGLFYCDGGQADLNAEVKFLDLGNARAGSYAEMTVAGTGKLAVRTANQLTLGTVANSRGRAVVNVNGRGTLKLGAITKASAAQNTAVLNFDGGTLEGSFTGDRAFFENLTDVVVYGGGANLVSSTGRFTLNQASRLRLAQGNGVAAVALSDGGSGFVAPPVITFTGGGGSNATAVAFIDYVTGSVTGVVVTCRGEGYSAAPVVGFTGGAGSGAAAVATLAANGGGALAFCGPNDVVINRQATFDGEVQACGGRVLVSSRNDASPGMPQISALRLNGGTFQNGSSGAETDCPYDDMINPSAVLIFGGARGSGDYVQPCGPVDNAHRQHFAALQVNTGKGRIGTTSDSTGEGRRAEVRASGFGREPGGLLYVSDSALASMGIRSGAANLFGVSGPVLAGVFANYSDFVTVNEYGDWIRLDVHADDDFGADKNYRMTEAAQAIAPDALAVNSVRLTDAADVTLSGAGTTVVASGMITVGSGSAGSVVAGGALTSGNGRDLVVYDAHTGFERRNTSANNVSLRIDSLIRDNGPTPVAFVAAGPANVSAMMLASGGATALTQPTNEYSGGTYVVDAALEPAGDRSLGAVPAAPETNIVTAGMAIMRAKKNAWPLDLHANRGICLRGGCLALTGDDNNQIGVVITRVNGPVSGHGALVFNHWAGGGVGSVIELTGDNRAFEGTYAVHGILRAQEGMGLSPSANLALCENNDTAAGTRAGGIVEMSGFMARTPGTGAGQVQWCRVNDVYAGLVGANDPAYSGGFSAYGGPLTVNLGGDRRVLTLGQDGFNPTVLRLQTDAATDDLTWENPVELAGEKSISIQIARNATTKQVFWRGAISNSAATVRAVTVRQNGKLILCDGADVGSNLIVHIASSLQCLVTNRQTLACDFRGTGPLNKWGAGVTFVTGVSTNTGAMRIYEGSWYANGQHTVAGAYTVSNNAVLGGAGVIAPAAGNGVTILGTLAPGAEPGACGTLTLGSAEQATTLTLNGTLALDISAESCDAVAVQGNVTVGDVLAVTVSADDEEVWVSRRGEVIPVLTWTGDLGGAAVPSVSGLSEGWKMKVDTAEKTACLFYVPSGTMIRLR